MALPGRVGALHVEMTYMRQYDTGQSQILTESSAIQAAHGEIATYLISGKVPL